MYLCRGHATSETLHVMAATLAEELPPIGIPSLVLEVLERLSKWELKVLGLVAIIMETTIRGIAQMNANEGVNNATHEEHHCQPAFNQFKHN